MVANIKWKTRKITEEDIEDVIQLYQDTRAEALPFLSESPSQGDTLEYLQTQLLSKTYTRISVIYKSSDPEDLGKIAGFVTLRGRPRPFIEHLYVAPKYWGQGVGGHLLGSTMLAAPTLELYCLQKNDRGKTFCQRQGFYPAKIVDETENIPSEPAILYRWIREYHQWSDVEYLEIFESLNLPIYEWTHRAHVRLAWIYLSTHSFSKALQLLRSGIQRFNDKNGFFQRYHETVTQVYATLILNRIQSAAPYDNFNDFIAANPQLIARKPPTGPYYSHAHLWSQEGRSLFLPPDLANLPIIATPSDW